MAHCISLIIDSHLNQLLSTLIKYDLLTVQHTVYRVYFNALIISEEAMHCENKNCEILKYADKKKCGIVEYEHVA